MNQKILTSIIVLLIFPWQALAAVQISEVMYDAPGTEGSGDHDWIEVFNSGTAQVDLSTYRFFEANTNHTLKVDQGSALLPAGGYAVISNIPATFKADYPAFSGTLFDSSFNLNSTGELISMRTGDLTDTETPFTYIPVDAATNNGSSLQRVSTASVTFAAAVPTPGTGSLQASSGGSDATSTPEEPVPPAASTPPSAPVSSFVAPPVPEVFADAGGNRTVIVGADIEFDGRAYNRQKEILDHVRFLWNFGDGAVAEGAAVLHHFEYPGRYAVVLTIAENKSASIDQLVVLAEPANLAFFNLSDGGVRIENRAGRDLDLSRWIVRQFGRDFPLPEHSVILAGSSMFISQKTLGFWSSPSVEFDYPNGVLALRAGESAGSMSVAVAPSSTAPTLAASVTTIPKAPPTPAAPKAATKQEQPGEVLGTSVSTAPAEHKNTSSALWLSMTALAGLLGIGAVGVRYLQPRPAKQAETSFTAEEFDIVE